MTEETETKEKTEEESQTNEETTENPEGEESPEDADEEGTMESGSFGSFFSPEAIIMLPFAVMLDSIGILLALFALDDFFITDIMGIAIIGGWSYFRSRQVQMTQGAQQKLGKMAKRMRRLKWLRPVMMLAEFIPYVGALPCWTILVYFELKSS